jgi:hypothetical protein
MPSSAARRERRQQKFGSASASSFEAVSAKTEAAAEDQPVAQIQSTATHDNKPAAPSAWDDDEPDEEQPDAGAAASAATPAAVASQRGGAQKIACTVFVGQLPYSADVAMV